MLKQQILEILNNKAVWEMPPMKDSIPGGDMPGDKIEIGANHIGKANRIFWELLKILPSALENNGSTKGVVAVYGGSGVGKSEIASLLSYYFNAAGIGSYTLSGDNYPRRIPQYNDAERLRIFRQEGIRALVQAELFNPETFHILRQLQEREVDTDREYIGVYSWFETYLDGGIRGLKSYLGTEKEIDFEELTEIIRQFKEGKNLIWLKRMGRTESELWYEKVGFTSIGILIIEWTHGNSDNCAGVDIPVFLNSTPEETLAHRRNKNRDGKTDRPFTMRALECEQQLLDSQIHRAKIVVSKSGELMTNEKAFCK